MNDDELSGEELDRMAEAETQACLGISFEEFKQKWFRGDYKGDPRPEVTGCAFWLMDDDEMDCE